jgi:hypothetical protein
MLGLSLAGGSDYATFACGKFYYEKTVQRIGKYLKDSNEFQE